MTLADFVVLCGVEGAQEGFNKGKESVMIAQWEKECISLTVCSPCGTGSIPVHGGDFQGILTLADHTRPSRPEPAWQKISQSPLNGNWWTLRRKWCLRRIGPSPQAYEVR